MRVLNRRESLLAVVTDYLGATLGTILHHTILVGSVLVAMKFLVEGAFLLALALILPLLGFLYLIVGDAVLLR